MGMSSNTIAPRRGTFALPHTLLVIGILASALVMAFGTGGAFSASAPKSGSPGDIIYYPTPDSEEPIEFEFADAPDSTKTFFKVRFAGKKSSESWSIEEGKTILDLINQAVGEEEAANVASVSIRPKTSGDNNYAPPTAVGSWYLNNNHPLIIVTKSDDKDIGAHFSQLPIMLPTQKDDNDNGNDIVRLTKNRDLEIKAFNGEALKVNIEKKSGPDSKGNYSFKADEIDGANYNWYLYNPDGTIKETDEGRSFTTTTLTTTPASYYVTVEASTNEDGVARFGSDTYTITTKKKDDGNTDSNSNNTNQTNSGGTQGSNGNTTGSTAGTGTTNTYKPPTYNPPKSTIPPVTPATGTSSADNSGLSEAVTGLRGTGTARAVSGVLLSTPPSTPNPAAGATDGRALEKLSAPLADAANNVFQPIQYPDNGWMLMVAVMFAAFILGGVKEFRNP